MNLNCARRGCRKKALYRLAVQKMDDDGEKLLTLQEWWVCLADRDAVQSLIDSTMRPARVMV